MFLRAAGPSWGFGIVSKKYANIIAASKKVHTLMIFNKNM